jgi:nitrogen fixation/metabolism regulation signal transduction histidine kinase
VIRFETRLLFLFTAFFIATVALVLLVGMRTERQLVESVDRDLRNILNTIQFSTHRLSAEQGPDREVLERFIEEAKRNRAVHEISVIGSTREVIASSNPERVGQHHELSGEEIVMRERTDETKPEGHKIHYDIRVPLFRGTQVVGLVQAYLEVEDYRYVLRQLYIKNAIIAAGATLFAFGLIFFVLNRLNRPLRRLIGAADRVASGDLTVRVEPRHPDEVGRLTSSFNAMIVRLAEQQELESKVHHLERRAILAEMASNLAHEVRNPLNLINLTADHLGRQFQPEGNEQRKAFQELIAGLKTEVRNLNKMVTDFLDMGRPSKLSRTRFAWSELFEEVQRSVNFQLLSKGVSLEFAGHPELAVVADREQMRLVLLNLLINAIAIVPEGGRIAIEVDAAPDSRAAIVSVTDSGPGISPEDVARIFEPYVTKRPGGTGLGLALVRRIVEEHGGTVHAGNVPGGGARFEFTVPMEA